MGPLLRLGYKKIDWSLAVRLRRFIRHKGVDNLTLKQDKHKCKLKIGNVADNNMLDSKFASPMTPRRENSLMHNGVVGVFIRTALCCCHTLMGAILSCFEKLETNL